MIELKVEKYNDMCGGATYSGNATFEGKTVKEVLEEIREFSKDKQARYLGDGFGNPNSKGCDHWSVSIDDVIYWNSWIKNYWNKYYSTYTNELDDLLVRRIDVSGGWYCFYNFTIYTEKYKGVK